ncbi:MAG: DUF2437 domain-containing protein [Thermovirga sp.]|nr:DUF2437 domain-containing protein [Thermovirga sp.]
MKFVRYQKAEDTCWGMLEGDVISALAGAPALGYTGADGGTNPHRGSKPPPAGGAGEHLLRRTELRRPRGGVRPGNAGGTEHLPQGDQLAPGTRGHDPHPWQAGKDRLRGGDGGGHREEVQKRPGSRGAARDLRPDLPQRRHGPGAVEEGRAPYPLEELRHLLPHGTVARGQP